MRPPIRGVTVVDKTQPASAAGLYPLVNPQRTSFRRERPPEGTPPEMARILQQMQENLHALNDGVSGLPEAGSRTYVKGQAFTSGVAVTIVHHLAVAGSAQVGFAVQNQRGAAGACYASAVDTRTITLVPNATFTADVLLYVVP